MSLFNIVASSNESTVVSEYVPEVNLSSGYQSESDLENDLIERLCKQGYEWVHIHSEDEFVDNLRTQIEKVNDLQFSDSEWDRFFSTYIANKNNGIVEKTKIIQEDNIKEFERDDGSSVNIAIIDKDSIHNNRLQVLNQYVVSKKDGAKYDNRYDVTILVNGLPLVHIELKKRGVNIKEAFNQIERYSKDSFWAGKGLFDFVQIFIISNGTETKYYSNTTRSSHIEEMNKADKREKSKNTSNSFEFTSYWADAKNKVIPDLVDFCKTFLTKHTLLSIITKYSIFTTDQILIVMRPYQIAATEKILNRIITSSNYKKYGTKEAGGYIWHTTGSGKTLTSFKTAQLATKIDGIQKVLFVVDRKDLDYQTMKEYDRFEKGAADGNTSTAILKKQLEDPNSKIIITTIQKLSNFIKKNKGHECFDKHVVIIFDECHRSQFGDMHVAITEKFKKYHIFGFTGTPITADNASSSVKHLDLITTPQAFGDELHAYTIVNAINDGNVLPFRIDYIKTFKEKEGIKDIEVKAIDNEKVLKDSRRINEITQYILDHFKQKTKRSKAVFNVSVIDNVSEVASAKNRKKVKEVKQKVHISGFNSIFAVASIEYAKLYYSEFKRLQEQLPKDQRLKVATIYSYGVNEALDDSSTTIDDENNEDTELLDQASRDFLENAINDYNDMFHTNYDTSSDKFQNYYRDVSLRMKNREIDILIVVNMFLTGFDATTLNTLWVDKNLKYHGLIQAFSRTNRILNSVKTFGNIVCFRNLEQQTNDALALFGNNDAKNLVLLKNFDAYYNGYDENNKHFPGYVELVQQLKDVYALPIIGKILGEKLEKEFIRLFSAILKLRNILSTFDEFEGKEILTLREFQDYQSTYYSLFEKYRKQKKGDKVEVNDDLVFEIELIKQVDINIGYILDLAKQYVKKGDQDIIVSIQKAVESSPALRSKLDLINRFIYLINPSSVVDDEWRKYITNQRMEELKSIIDEEQLKLDETLKFMASAFRDGELKTTGTDIDSILPPIRRFGGGNRAEKKERVIEKLANFFDRYLDFFYGDDSLANKDNI